MTNWIKPTIQVVTNQGGDFMLLWLREKMPEVEWVSYAAPSANLSEVAVTNVSFTKDAKINRLERQNKELQEKLKSAIDKVASLESERVYRQYPLPTQPMGPPPRTVTAKPGGGFFDEVPSWVEREIYEGPKGSEEGDDDDGGFGGVREPRRPLPKGY